MRGVCGSDWRTTTVPYCPKTCRCSATASWKWQQTEFQVVFRRKQMTPFSNKTFQRSRFKAQTTTKGIQFLQVSSGANGKLSRAVCRSAQAWTRSLRPLVVEYLLSHRVWWGEKTTKYCRRASCVCLEGALDNIVPIKTIRDCTKEGLRFVQSCSHMQVFSMVDKQTIQDVTAAARSGPG